MNRFIIAVATVITLALSACMSAPPSPADAEILTRKVFGFNDNNMTITVFDGAAESVTSIDPQTLAGGFTANTRYYVYASKSPSPTYSVSTDKPLNRLRRRAIGSDDVLISTFYVDSRRNLISYTQTDDKYTYASFKTVGGGVDSNLFLDRGDATKITTVAIGPALPDGATEVTIKAGAETSEGWATTVVGRDLVGGPQNVQAELHPTVYDAAVTVFPLSALSTSVDYVNDASTTKLSLWVAGFVY